MSLCSQNMNTACRLDTILSVLQRTACRGNKRRAMLRTHAFHILQTPKLSPHLSDNAAAAIYIPKLPFLLTQTANGQI
jgi:hypothetical protein